MILDSIDRLHSYVTLHPRFAKVMECFAAFDYEALAPGEIKWDGEEIQAIIIHDQLVSEKESTDYFECHNTYIDIQIVYEGVERVGWKSRSNCLMPRGEYSTEKDVLFYEDSPELFFELRPGHFAIYFPNDVHAPMIGEGAIKKMVIKVKVG
ncbi:YhcH/YjgK/YiaL family protein [Sediminibacterium sp.]|uniref:YhcH/YjgK/YiaL family protein n=1 Tax=Sediminibacterium sp. TaxID=1917865 RepID=UPI003F71FF71